MILVKAKKKSKEGPSMNPLFKERLAFVGHILLAILIACSLFLLGFYGLSWLIVRLLYLFENKGIVEHFVPEHLHSVENRNHA